MKVGQTILRSLLVVILGLSGLNYVVNPSPAQAAGESYLFAYPKAAVDNMKNDVEDNSKSANNMSSSSVWVKGGLFGDTQFKLPFSEQRSQQNGNEREYVYSQTYDCTNRGLVVGSVIPRDGLKIYKVTLAARVRLGTDFESKSPSGNSFVPEFTIREGSNETKYGPGGRTVNLNDIPSACRPSTRGITLANFQRLSDAQKNEWASAKNEVERQQEAIESAERGGGSADDNACASSDSAGAFAWALCPAISTITSTLRSIQDEAIVNNLKVEPLNPNDGYGQALYQIWSNIRNVANAAFVLIFIYIIIANTLSIGLNAYTIKKMLPRLVAGAILVQFSFIFTAIAIDIGNILGTGVAGLVDFSVSGTTAGGSGTSFSEVARSVLVLGAAGATVIGLVGVPTIVVILLGGLIGLIGVVFTLIARKLIIAVLVVTSALALVAWVLPGTERFFKMWYQNLIKVILMYPLIVLLLKLSTVLAGVTSEGGDFQILLAATFPIIAWYLIPMTWRWGGGLMSITGGQIGQITGKTKGLTQSKLKNSRPMQAYEQNKQMRRELKLGDNLGATGMFGAPKRWAARTAITGAPFGGRLNPRDGGFGKRGPIIDRQLDEAQRGLWSKTQKTMAGLSTDDLTQKLNSRNSTQAAAAAGALAEKGKLNSSHLAQLRNTFKGNETEGKRALAYSKSQMKDKASNPVAAHSSWDDIESGHISNGTRDKILQTTTPSSLGGLSVEGLTDLQNTTTEDGRSMLSQIDNKTIEKALDTASISGKMNRDVRDALEQHVGRGQPKPNAARTAGREGAQLDLVTPPTSGRNNRTTTGGATAPPLEPPSAI